MQFNFPSFINKSEQDESRLLFNSVKLALQTNIQEIWYDTKFGTHIRDLLKQGINAFVVAEIQQDIEDNLMKYFKDEIKLDTLDAWQDLDTVKVELKYIELRTGKRNTVQAEQKFINTDLSLY